MDYFQLGDKINQLHQLDFAERAILNQITSYFYNNNPFFATNEYLSKYWGVSERSISRYISKLSKLGYITIQTEKKKHTVGEGKWYNKRYILPVIEAITTEKLTPKEKEITNPLPIIDKPVITPIQEPIITTNEQEDDEPFMGVYPPQDTPFTRYFDELEKSQPTPAVSAATLQIINEPAVDVLDIDSLDEEENNFIYLPNDRVIIEDVYNQINLSSLHRVMCDKWLSNEKDNTTSFKNMVCLLQKLMRECKYQYIINDNVITAIEAFITNER